MKEFWDERYANQEYIYGLAPNSFLVEKLEQLPVGKILFPCEGEGRNAVFAAQLGWEVAAFDFSEMGQQKSLALAKKRGVNITYTIDDALEFTAEAESFDVIAFIYTHFPENIRPQIFQNLLGLLKPGGKIIMEVFNKSQLGKDSGGPKDLGMLYNKEIIAALFSSFEFLQLDKCTINLNEGEYHKGDAEVIRVLAVKNT